MSRPLDPSKRVAVLRAAEELFLSKRFHEVTVEEIARHAGVGKGTLYRHFPDKDGLVAAALSSGFEDLCAELEDQSQSTLPLRDRLLATASAIASFFARRRSWFGMLHAAEGLHPGLEEHRRDIHVRRKRVAEMIGRVLTANSDELTGEMPIDVIAQIFLGMLRNRARSCTEASDVQLVDLLLNGIRKPVMA
jgi:AcrR family transcriptional regulator